jgi:transposase InsO family protein
MELEGEPTGQGRRCRLSASRQTIATAWGAGLKRTLFFDLHDAQTKITAWVADYNGQRPHSSLKYLTPAAYAATFTATGARLRNPDQLRRSPVAPPAPHGIQKTETLIAAG